MITRISRTVCYLVHLASLGLFTLGCLSHTLLGPYSYRDDYNEVKRVKICYHFPASRCIPRVYGNLTLVTPSPIFRDIACLSGGTQPKRYVTEGKKLKYDISRCATETRGALLL